VGNKGLSIDISGTNQIYSGWTIEGPIDYLSATAKTAMLGTPVVFTGSISTTTLNVTAVSSGTISVGMIITGTRITGRTTITALGTGTGGTGTYTVSVSQTVPSTSISGKTQSSAGAYGFRLLYSGYKGPIIQIKNGSGGTPYDFYADADGNLGINYLGTGTSLAARLGAANPAYYVVTWYDQTGNGNHGTGVNTPIYDTANKTVNFASGYFNLPNNAYPTGNLPYTYIYTPILHTCSFAVNCYLFLQFDLKYISMQF
jgi:hypothetical protein